MKLKNLFPIIFILIISNTACSQNNLNEKDNVGSSPLDLKYINDEAKKLVKSYNDENGTNWRSLDADLRVLVHKCITPLKAKWLMTPDRFSTLHGKYLDISVSCEKSVYKGQSWYVLVPTNRPYFAQRLKGN